MKYRSNFISYLLLILFVFFILQIQVKGQSTNTPLEIIRGTRIISNISYEKFLNEKSEMILVSELHNIASTYQILESIVSQTLGKGFGNIIQEMSFSYSIVCNEYIENGDSSLLNIISSSNEAKLFFKKIRELSLQKPLSITPRFFGIDFELSEGRIQYMRSAIQILLAKYSYDIAIQKVLKEIITKESLQEIKVLKSELRNLLNQRFNSYSVSNEGLDLLRLFANRNDEYFQYRDAQLYQNFLEIDSLLRKTNPHPKYIGSFGLAHIKTSLKNNFSSILLRDSYWKSRISIIGTHYYHCVSNYRLKKETLVNDIGVLSKSNSKYIRSEIKNDTDTILLLAKENPFQSGKKEFNYSLILILMNYPGETRNLQKINE